jgi:disulfide bond formation protein DsbB
MTTTTIIFNQISAWLVFFSNVSVVIISASLLGKRFEICNKILSFVKKYTYRGAFLFVLAGTLGSLVYSEFIGFEPCLLCWIQRIFLYPLTVLIFIALLKKEKVITDYILGLAVPGALVSLYHYLAQFGGISITKCTGPEGSCSVIYFTNLGYITIPFMAFSVFSFVIILMLVEKIFKG